MTDLEILERAKMYIVKMANGINPITDEQVKEEDTLNNVRVSRCLFYVSGVLDKVINQGIKAAPRSKKEAFSITSEDLEKFQYSEYPIYVSAIVNQLNILTTKENVKKINSRTINEWLLSIGLLKEIEEPLGVFKKQPTDEGIKMGIIAEKRISPQGRPYTALSYNNAMQHFIIENLQEIIDKTEEIKMQQKQIRQERRSNSIPNAGLPWTKEQEDLLVQLFKENITIQEIADSMKRSTNSISARLNKLGLIA